MAWLILLLAGMAETSWIVGLKHTAGFTRIVPSVFTVFFMIVSLVLLSQAVKVLPIGTAYAVWVSIGASGALMVGMFALGEPREPLRIACVALIVIGVVGLYMTESRPDATTEQSAMSESHDSI